MFRKFLPVLLTTILSFGCAAYPGGSPINGEQGQLQGAFQAPQLSGQVVFPGRRVLAGTNYAHAATVSIIRASDNKTIAATVSTATGEFGLTFPAGFTPDPAALYYLEAVKGAEGNMPGNEAVRLRTMVRYQDGWVSLNNAVAGGAIVLDTMTTALSIGGALRASTATPVDLTQLIGKYEPATGTYTPVANLSGADVTALKSLVERSVLDSEDPVWHIGVDSNGAFVHQANFVTMLHGVDKPYISAGETLTLEGNFGAGALVNFPGGQTVPLSSVCANRGSVVVPSGVLPGELSVTSRRTTSAVGQRFNPLMFTPSLSNFSRRDEQTAVAMAVTTLGNARRFHTSAVIGNYLYVLGGGGNSGRLNSIERAVINADGSLGSFSNVTPATSFTARHDHTSAVIGNYLYVMGGGGNSGLLNSIERAVINADGSLGSFSNVTPATSFTPRANHTSAVIGNYLYVMGGSNLNSIERAVINADGSLGSFSNVTPVTSFTPRGGHSSAIIGNYLYVMGGYGNAYLNSIERAVINADGSLGNFSNVTPAISFTAKSGHTSAVVGNHLYMIGGDSNSGLLNSIERSSLNANGSPGNFSNVTPATSFTARYAHTSAVIGNYLYVIGGAGTSGFFNSIERALINADGSLGSFSNVTPATSFTARVGHTSAVIGNYLYVIGGYTYSNYNYVYINTVERALINADGGIGNFTNVTPAISFLPRMKHTTILAGGYLYIIGGSSGSGQLNSIERAVVNEDGSLGNFANVTPASSFAARSGHTSAVSGNYLYVMGGYSGSPLNSIERAIINADGTIGNFSNVTPSSSFGARRTHTAAIIGNYLYVMGGEGAGILNSIERSLITANGTLGNFSNVTPPSSFVARWQHTSVVIGNSLYVIGGMSSTNAYLNTVERANFL